MRNWSSTTRIWQNVCHVVVIPALTKSRFGKNLSNKVLTPEQQFISMDGPANEILVPMQSPRQAWENAESCQSLHL